MIHHDPERAFVMVHAGIAPAWTVGDAIGYGEELSRALQAPDHRRLLRNMYGNEPDEWRDSLTGHDRLRFITNAFTRMRYCHADGRLDVTESRPPGAQAPSLTPWFTLRDGGADRVRIAFGHWATLQLRAALPRSLHVRHVDTGCVWGGSLTALRIEDDRGIQDRLPPWRVACSPVKPLSIATVAGVAANRVTGRDGGLPGACRHGRIPHVEARRCATPRGAATLPGGGLQLVCVLRHEVEIEQPLVGIDEPRGDRPRHSSIADRATVDRRDRHHAQARRGQEALVASKRIEEIEIGLVHGDAFVARELDHRLAADAGQHETGARG